jgi:hypothetical protein
LHIQNDRHDLQEPQQWTWLHGQSAAPALLLAITSGTGPVGAGAKGVGAEGARGRRRISLGGSDGLVTTVRADRAGSNPSESVNSVLVVEDLPGAATGDAA